MRGVISPQLTQQSLNLQSSKVSSAKKERTSHACAVLSGTFMHLRRLPRAKYTFLWPKKTAQTNLLWPFFFRLSRCTRVGGDPDPVSAGGGSPHCPHLSSLARALSSPLSGDHSHMTSQLFRDFQSLPLVTVTVTQPISILVLFWAKPLLSSVRTRGRHM